jgi:hypothetical protein
MQRRCALCIENEENAMLRTIALTLCLAAIAGHSHAQECVDVARVMAINSIQSQSSDQQQAITQSQLCSSDYQSASDSVKASISAAYGLFSGSAGASVDKIEAMQSSRCDNKFGEYWSNKVSSLNAASVSAIGAKVVLACFQTRSFRLVGMDIGGTGITSTFQNGNLSPVTINTAVVRPADAATCTAGINDRSSSLSELVGKTLATGDTVTLSCQRTAQTVADQPGAQHFPGGLITVATRTDAATVPLFEYYQPNISHNEADELRQSLTSLANKLTSDEQQLPVYENRMVALEKLFGSLSGVIFANDVDCGSIPGFKHLTYILLPVQAGGGDISTSAGALRAIPPFAALPSGGFSWVQGQLCGR